MIGVNRALSPMTSEPAAASPPFGTLLDETPHDCPYLPGRTAVLPARWYDKALDGDQVDALLAQADRRVGRTLYRPSCPSCQECKALRVPVMDFTPTRSQRRVMKQNEDIEVLAGPPQSTPERLALFNKHKLQRGLGEALSTLAHYRSWLVTSCVQTIETCYVLKGEVIGVGILDLGRLDAEAQVEVIAVDYRLAPEHPAPAAYDDARAALHALRALAPSLGLDERRLAVGGDSAGGNLAAALSLQDTHSPPLRAQLLLYPLLDHRCDSPSFERFKDGYYLSAAQVRWFREQYLGDDRSHDADPEHSPLLAQSLSGSPPTVLHVAGLDVLRDEGLAYAARLESEGVPVTLLRAEGLPHAFGNLAGALPAADDALRLAARALAGHLA